jgi:cobalt-zinc-cadmium efflux system membrane fusion protein
VKSCCDDKAWTFALLILCGLCAILSVPPAQAHEGHDHDKPPPLNLPVAPRVIAVTPELELVGVLSGKERLTVFLHEFATNAPVAAARMTVSADADSIEAKPDGAGVFTVAAPWIAKGATVDLLFAMTLHDGGEDLLTGRLEVPQSLERAIAANPGPAAWYALLAEEPRLVWGIGGSFIGGVLVTLLVLGGRRAGPEPEPAHTSPREVSPDGAKALGARKDVTPLRRLGVLAAGIILLSAIGGESASSAGTQPNLPPSVPSMMATDQPQRMADATLFIPKATQHLLSIRTQLASRTKAAKTVELSGRVTVGPQNLGRVQPNRPGRFQAAGERVGFAGMAVEAGQILGYVETYIEAADRASIVSQIAETEARIAKNRTILSRYEKSPDAVPPVKMDEARGELQALIKRREELLPSTSAREPLVAPITGIISAARVVVGQVVEPRDVLFEIIDPSEFWIEAVAAHPEVAENLEAAFAVIHGHERVDLEYLGRGLALRHHSTILNFKISGSTANLAAGMTARVVLQSKEKSEGFVLPASAVVRGPSGLPIVWLKTQPERFEPQTVKVEPFDGDSVVVTAGLKPDQRVVTDGVTLLNQVR